MTRVTSGSICSLEGSLVAQKYAEGTKKSERRDNEVGAPDNRSIVGSKSLILTPRLETSIAGTWIGRHRSARDYSQIKNYPSRSD